MFQPTVCNDSHDVLLMSSDINSIAILNNDVDYRCTVNRISKSEAIHLFKKADLSENRGSLYKNYHV